MSADLRRNLPVVWLQANWRGRELIQETRGGTNGGYGPGQITGHISYRGLLCSSGCASAMAPGPRDHFYSYVLKGVTVTVTDVGIRFR